MRYHSSVNILREFMATLVVQPKYVYQFDQSLIIDFLDWLFHTKSTDYAKLPENTSLQRNVKKHLLSGGVIRNAFGRLKV